MVIRQTSQRVERRRRVLTDERREAAKSVAGDSADRNGAERTGRRYTPAASRDEQLVVSDLIPQRGWTVLVWCLASACFLFAHAALQAAYDLTERLKFPVDLTPLSLGQSQQLPTFSFCLTLSVASLYGLLVLNFRRHRMDDYRGRYRIWYYVVALLAAIITLAGSGLTTSVTSAVAWLVDSGGIPVGLRTVGGLGLAIGALVVLRLWMEMRASRGATVCLALASGFAIVCAALAWLGTQAAATELISYLRALSQLAAAQMLLMSFVLYSRRVYLEAQGLVASPARKARRKRRSGTKAATADAKRRREPEAANESRPPLAGKRKRQTASTDERLTTTSSDDGGEDAADETDEEAPPTVKISRAERRRQRKEKQRQRRAA